MKRISNELVFIDRAEDLLKEALIVLKKCDPTFQSSVLGVVDELSLTEDTGLFHRIRLLKALFLVSKLGMSSVKTDETKKDQSENQN